MQHIRKCISIYLLILSPFITSFPSKADDIGMTLPRSKVIQSCINEKSDRCDYLVFFDFQSLPANGQDAHTLPHFLQKTLPSQLISLMSNPSTSQAENCNLQSLSNFIDGATNTSQRGADKDPILAELPHSINSCFRRGESNYKISVIAIDGEIPGFVYCTPDYERVDLCEIMFSRINAESRIHAIAEERIKIGPFRRDEVIEILSNFPHFPLNGNNNAENDFLSALLWVAGTLSSKVHQMRSGG
jgi:hypothetical protein